MERTLTAEQAVRVVREYTGNPHLEVEVIEDPQVPGTFAARDEAGEYHLVTGPNPDQDVEWVEFSQWPPRSRGWSDADRR